jgi:hypothetical protein
MKELPDWVFVADREMVETTLTGTATTADPSAVAEQATILRTHFNVDGKEPKHEDGLVEPHNSFTYQRTSDGAWISRVM